jgi:hypothetical protein
MSSGDADTGSDMGFACVACASASEICCGPRAAGVVTRNEWPLGVNSAYQARDEAQERYIATATPRTLVAMLIQTRRVMA